MVWPDGSLIVASDHMHINRSIFSFGYSGKVSTIYSVDKSINTDYQIPSLKYKASKQNTNAPALKSRNPAHGPHPLLNLRQ